MLSGAILLIVVVLFFSIRAFMGSGKGDSSKDTADEQVTADNDQEMFLLLRQMMGRLTGRKTPIPWKKLMKRLLH